MANVGHDLEDSLSFLVRYFVSFIHVDIGSVVTNDLTGWDGWSVSTMLLGLKIGKEQENDISCSCGNTKEKEGKHEKELFLVSDLSYRAESREPSTATARK